MEKVDLSSKLVKYTKGLTTKEKGKALVSTRSEMAAGMKEDGRTVFSQGKVSSTKATIKLKVNGLMGS